MIHTSYRKTLGTAKRAIAYGDAIYQEDIETPILEKLINASNDAKKMTNVTPRVVLLTKDQSQRLKKELGTEGDDFDGAIFNGMLMVNEDAEIIDIRKS